MAILCNTNIKWRLLFHYVIRVAILLIKDTKGYRFEILVTRYVSCYRPNLCIRKI